MAGKLQGTQKEDEKNRTQRGEVKGLP